MKEPIFIQTSRGDRTNILANFTLLSKESFIKSVKEDKGRRSQYRYGYIDGTVDNLVSMRLEEFEQVFPEQPFTQEEITREFRKEISEKYGKHAIKETFLKKFERGGVYEDKYGIKYIYLGKVKKSVTNTKRTGTKTEEGSGFAYCSVTMTVSASSIEVFKGAKSNIKQKVGQIDSLESRYVDNFSSYYNGETTTIIELL